MATQKGLGKGLGALFGDINEQTETPAEGAVLQIEMMPIVFRCRDCGREFAFDAHGTDDCSCPACHGLSYDMISGKEFLIESMEAS